MPFDAVRFDAVRFDSIRIPALHVPTGPPTIGRSVPTGTFVAFLPSMSPRHRNHHPAECPTEADAAAAADGNNNDEDPPFRVIGIALIVEQKGESPRCVLRYPPSSDDDEEMFFQLSPRQLAKLFRPKKPLCGKPMTLSVGGTIFCCLAVDREEGTTACRTMEANHHHHHHHHSNHTSTTNNNNNNNEILEILETNQENHLVLFSLVVAVVAKNKVSSIPIAGWFQENEEQRQEKTTTHNYSEATQVSASFLAMRRVHVSLARVCKVLEREERRCQYVSLQAQLFGQIRNDMQQTWREREQKNATRTSNTNNSTSLNASSSSAKPRGQRHRRAGSFSATFEVPPEDDSRSSANSKKKEQELDPEREQELLELFMAAEPTFQQHGGNLARELIKLFHTLARNDHDFPPTPAMMLTGRDGFIYINRHISVPIEPLSPYRPLANGGNAVARSYQTLLFPYASPNQLLEALTKAGSSTTRRLQQFLIAMNPQKSLTDIAADAHLPLPVALELGTYLLRQGVCVASPVISRMSRFMCPRISLIQEHCLPFAQAFSNLSLFIFVSFLTQSNRTLAETAVLLASPRHDATAMLVQERLSSTAMLSLYETLPDDSEHAASLYEDLEKLLFRIVVWLCSRRVLVQLQEFYVAEEETSVNIDEPNETDQDGKQFEKRGSSEKLFQQLMEAGCLLGTVSLPACSWRVGVDAARLRAYAANHPQIYTIQRAALPTDDWGADDQQNLDFLNVR